MNNILEDIPSLIALLEMVEVKGIALHTVQYCVVEEIPFNDIPAVVSDYLGDDSLRGILQAQVTGLLTIIEPMKPDMQLDAITTLLISQRNTYKTLIGHLKVAYEDVIQDIVNAENGADWLTDDGWG